MPILLTTPIDVGDTDEADYTHLKIIQLRLDIAGRKAMVYSEVGRYDNTTWVRGSLHPSYGIKPVFSLEGADYDAIVSLASAGAGEVYYDKIATALYQYMIDHNFVVGTIV